MLRNLIFGLALAGILLETGCSTCTSCGHPLFNKHRRCDDCANGTTIPPTGVPVVPPPNGGVAPPPGAIVPAPPATSGYGPTPDAVAPGGRVYVNSYSNGCCR
jgi:hypothetical protein